MTEPVPPPEALLIRRCREAARPKLSMNAAAKAMKFSGSRWRQIENGYQTIAAGVRSPVVAPAETLAHMAQVVGATAEQVEEAGREDAAKIMREGPSRLGQALAHPIPIGPPEPDHIDAMDVGSGPDPGIVAGAEIAWRSLMNLADAHGNPRDTHRAVIGSADFYVDALLLLRAGPEAKPLLREIYSKLDDAVDYINERNGHALEAEAKQAAQGEAGEVEKSVLADQSQSERLDPASEEIISSAADVNQGNDGGQQSG